MKRALSLVAAAILTTGALVACVEVEDACAAPAPAPAPARVAPAPARVAPAAPKPATAPRPAGRATTKTQTGGSKVKPGVKVDDDWFESDEDDCYDD